MAATRFSATPESGFERIALVRETPSRIPLRKPTIEAVPFDDWTIARPATATAALARMLQALGDGETAPDGRRLVDADGTSALLHPAFVAALVDGEAEALGLPAATRLALDLRSTSLLTRSDFRIDARWVKLGGVFVATRVEGARIHHDGRPWRLPEPMYSTLANVAAVNSAQDVTSRAAALSTLKRAIGDDAGSQIATDGTIERLRIGYASGFSLSLKASAAGFDFDPVLFSRDRLDRGEDGTALDEMADSLLPPALATDFAKRFRQGDGSRRAYLLEDGSLLFLDPQLTRMLGVVRRAQAGDAAARRAFASNPERAIAEALGRPAEEPADAARLFVETQQFSERVAGIDIWRKPVLPWIKPKPNSWLPEKFGLWVGDPPGGRRLEVAPEHVVAANAALEKALQEGRSTFRVDGVDADIPATEQTRKALQDLSDLVAAESEVTADSDDPEPPSVARQRYFLQVRDNLEEVSFAPILPGGPAGKAPTPAMPAALRTSPKPHQQEGFAWLTSCWRAETPGALLADDMGLGKTFQALAFLAWMRAEQPQLRPTLIVAPTGLLANWRAEIERHLSPGALGEVRNAYGAELGRLRDGKERDIDVGDSRIDVGAWSHAGVVLTTYETMRDYHLSFARIPFAAIVYDEAQKLKNPASQMTRAAKTLNARFQLAMTGTPVENQLQDLWSIYDVIHPSLLGSSRQFETDYPSSDPDRLKALNDLLTKPRDGRPALLLRRMKDDCLAGLPTKIVRTIPVAMPARQRDEYDKVIGRALAVKGTGERGRVLEMLQHLRGVSLHPRAPETAGADSGYFEDSARLVTLFKLLDEIAAKREKALIFCESLAMQALLATEIHRRFELDHPVARIHGGVTGELRQEAVDAFQARGPGFDAMILSPKAGGVGLTLTAANHVIHLSRWWNPAVEDQATDRAFRIGQTRDVTVYLPQAVHPDPSVRPASFDLKLHELMEGKRTLSRGLLMPGESESDASELFDAVVGDDVEEPALPAGAEPPEARPPAQEPRPAQTQRSQPPLRAAAEAPLAPPRPAWPRRVEYQAHSRRDMAIFLAPVKRDPIVDLSIVDPYAAAGDRSRQCVVDFCDLLAGENHRAIRRVHLTTYDADSIGSDYPESNEKQYADLQTKWQRAFGVQPPLIHVQRSKRQDRGLHDREVRARTQSGRVLIWDIGRGIDGVMIMRFNCRVNLTEE